jgi:hypothetical protein
VSKQLGTWPSYATVNLLRSWGVRYVLVGARSYGSEWPAVQQRMEAIEGLTEVAVFADQPLFHGDRLLKYVRPTRDVPATELISGDQRAYLDDEVHVYVLK